MRRSQFLARIIALFTMASVAHATNYTVGPDGNCGYSTIAAALIAAANQLSGSRPVIYISAAGTYSGQSLSIGDTSLSLVGGVPDCSHFTPAGSTTITGGNGGAVITVRSLSTGHTITLSHLTITNGHGNDGGGIDFSAQGSLSIDNTTITENHANNGAGIRFVGQGGEADLYLNANTFITYNTAAHTGGGIRADLQAMVHIDADPTWIALNQAGDYGGGVAVVGGAYAHIGSPGYLFGPVIYENTANYGGGIAGIAESTGDAKIDLFAADPTRPVQIGTNRAYHAGGGAYLIPYAHMEAGGAIPENLSTLQMKGARIDDNSAPEGSGIYGDTYVETSVGTFYYGPDIYIYDGSGCPSGKECNSVSDNHAVTLDNMGHDIPTTGSAILLQTDSTFVSRNLAMHGNDGGYAIRVADSLHDVLSITTCLIVDNPLTADIVSMGNAAGTFDGCTIAGNDIGGDAVFNVQSGLTLTRSIISQGSTALLHYPGAGSGMDVEYLLVDPTAPVPPFASHVVNADPGFVDPASGDYHLVRSSAAVDAAPAGQASDRDLDGNPRDKDMHNVPNTGGVRDLGAYERQISCGADDSIFCDNFEL